MKKYIYAMITVITFITQPIFSDEEFDSIIQVSQLSSGDESTIGTKFCTLREAIISANKNTAYGGCLAGYGNDLIKVPAGTYSLTITGDSEDESLTGDLDIKSNVTIRGVASGGTIIDASGLSDRVFHVISGNVTLENLAIINGVAVADGKTIVNGGAILNAGKLTINNVTIKDSYAQDGGAIYSGGTSALNIISSTIANNTAVGKGGGLYNKDNSSFNITGSTIMNNTSASDGGGIYNYGSVLAITGSTIKENVSSGGLGGGIANYEELTLKKSAVVGNKTAAKSGGGIYNAFVLKLEQSAVIGNTSNEDGGGIYNGNMGQTTVVNSTVRRNLAKNNGGGIYNMSTAQSMIITNATIAENSAVGYGGGIANDNPNSKIVLQNTIIAYNSLSDKNDVDIIIGKSDCWGNFFSYDPPNIIGYVEDCNINTGKNQLGKDPKLGSFDDQSNSYSLLSDSPAIDSGTCKDYADAVITEDQLGEKRPAGNGCDIGAVEAICGDGVAHPAIGEECDKGAANSNAGSCTVLCKAAKCGDSFVQAGVETCDDGNTADGDGCNGTCVSEKCGDAVLQSGLGEACDDANSDDTDACLTTCAAASCSDGFVQTGVEDCDDGNSVDTDACLSTCKAAKCGDGYVKAGVEECDDGNVAAGDGCDAVCKKEVVVITVESEVKKESGTGEDEVKKESGSGSSSGEPPVSGGAAPATEPTAEAPAAPASGGGCSLIR